MRKKILLTRVLIFLLLAGFLLSGCNLMSLLYPQATPTTIPTPTIEPVKELRVCLGSEPRSLYAYKAASTVEKEVLAALTDGPIDIFPDGSSQAVLLEKMPSFVDGSASFSSVSVQAGDIVVNNEGNLVVLAAGVSVYPSGCSGPECVLVWDGASALQVDQLSATYTLKKGLKWSDGEPLTADDSLYAFELAADPATPSTKKYVDLTAGYDMLDEWTVQWTAAPGLVTDDFASFFWAPLPRHAWTDIGADALLSDENANRSPLSYGPFMLAEWVAGSHIRLVRNPNYHRAAEGLPAADVLTFKFLSTTDPASLLTAAQAECDIVSSSALDLQDIEYLRENAPAAGMQLADQTPSAIEMIAFGIKPSSYDDSYSPFGGDRPDFFGDVRTRQALAYCIDRQTLINKLLGGAVEAADSILAPEHPLLTGSDLAGYDFDPSLAATLLGQVGWLDVDLNPQTPLTAASVPNIPPGTAFEVELLLSESPLRVEIAAEISAQLAACGVKANITQLPLSALYQPGPDGLLFGRKFDLALLSLQTAKSFECGLFSSAEIPSDANYWLGASTGGANFFGFASEAYDTACDDVEQSGLNHSLAEESAKSALRLLQTELPFIPLYYHPQAVLLQDGICGISMGDPAGHVFQRIEEIVAGDDC